jgi:hypothetical protein
MAVTFVGKGDAIRWSSAAIVSGGIVEAGVDIIFLAQSGHRHILSWPASTPGKSL